MQPHLETWKRRGFDVIFVTTDSAQQIASFKQQRQVQMTVYQSPDRTLYQLYQVTGIPVNFIVDQKGNLVHRKLGWGTGGVNEIQKWVDKLCPAK